MLIISHWFSSCHTIEFLGYWKRFNNPNFNLTEFSSVKNESGSNCFGVNEIKNPLLANMQTGDFSYSNT
jgi:hypothetical protein